MHLAPGRICTRLAGSPSPALPHRAPTRIDMTSIRLTRCDFVLASAIMAVAVAVVPAHAQETKPNIVLVLMDNLRWGELGVYGGGILRGAPTPCIDKLAGEGMRLLNLNVEAQCAPSRAALMTEGTTDSSRDSGSLPAAAGSVMFE